MNILKRWKVYLVLLLVFVAGAVTGSFATVVHFKNAFKRGLSAENWTAEAMKWMQRELSLTPEQQPKIRAILDETGRQFRASFGEAVCVSGTNLVRSWQQIERELTPEQREIHQRRCREFREEVRKLIKVELPES